jgi:hypothetical protein
MREGQFWLLRVCAASAKSAAPTFDGICRLNGQDDPLLMIYRSYCRWDAQKDDGNLFNETYPILIDSRQDELQRAVALKVLVKHVIMPNRVGASVSSAPTFAARYRRLNHSITTLLASGKLPDELRYRLMASVVFKPGISLPAGSDEAMQLRYVLSTFTNSQDPTVIESARMILEAGATHYDVATQTYGYYPEIVDLMQKQSELVAPSNAIRKRQAKTFVDDLKWQYHGPFASPGFRKISQSHDKFISWSIPEFDGSTLSRQLEAASHQ